MLNKTIRHGNRAALIIQSMLGLVRDQTKNREQVKLAHIIEESFQCLARDFDKDHIKVVVDVPENLTVSAVPGQLQQVLLNLIINARQAMSRPNFPTSKAPAWACPSAKPLLRPTRALSPSKAYPPRAPPLSSPCP